MRSGVPRRATPRTARHATPRHATNAPQVEVLRELVASGADLDAVPKDGGAAVVRAAWWGRLGALRALAELGADMGATMAPASLTAAQVARGRGHARAARWLERSSGWTRLQHACDGRRGVSQIAALLRSGADPALPNAKSQETPLALCRFTEAAAGALPEDAEATALIQSALLPWHPKRHWLFPRATGPRVLLLLLVQQRRGRGQEAPRMIWLYSVMPFLLTRSRCHHRHRSGSLGEG